MNKQEIHEAIKDYRWMMRLLISKRQESVNGSNGLTAKYGIEATLPKPQGDPSDPVYQEMLRIEKYEKNTRRIRKKVLLIQKHAKSIVSTKDQLILDELLDAKPLRDIAIDLDMSVSAVKRRKDAIVNQIYLSVQAEQMAQMAQKRKI